MIRKPNPLLIEFLDKDLPLPSVHWETVPPGVNLSDVWDAYDENIQGWVFAWFPTGDPRTGVAYGEFERACLFNDNLERILKVMHRWPLWGSPASPGCSQLRWTCHRGCKEAKLLTVAIRAIAWTGRLVSRRSREMWATRLWVSCLRIDEPNS